jgi:predicted nucleic acid-binding Zn ribbon protein
MSDDPIKECPECGKEVRRNIFGGSGVIFKGSGFYVNDSKGKNPVAPAAKPNSGDAPGSSKPESAPAAQQATGASSQAGSSSGAGSGGAASGGAASGGAASKASSSGSSAKESA